ncbi:DUF3866 family protein [Desulfolucanica intricata]|uniref:DUF3866 family protein n=1 Tax=Desulfolucanica intricata TaxID=1285191 RepID=UPI00082A1A68|nr:DUF3866 family protein [Desulfolucanica intricata]
MIRIRRGSVLKIISYRSELTEVLVDINGNEQKAINYNHLTGTVKIGDQVILNTTAVYKNLGTGGTHFIMANMSSPEHDIDEAGHIMKLRYTPNQVKVLAVEEQESPYSKMLKNIKSLNQTPVIIGTLHSMLPVAAATAHQYTEGKAKIVYIMTDGAALPIALSKIVNELKEKKLLSATVTCGHAFGGDYETVNIYTALLAAKGVANADIIIVTMGPGIVGTGTEFGFTGVEQGEIINAVNILSGKPVAIPRISFADPRERHRGISHHTLTALGKIALSSSLVCIPKLNSDLDMIIQKQLVDSGIKQKHVIKTIDSSSTSAILKHYGLKVKTMGRGIEDDPAFFLACGAAGIGAAEMISF